MSEFSAEKMPTNGKRVKELCYGENRWQEATLYANENPPALSMVQSEQTAGTTPSYINIADGDRLLESVAHVAAGWSRNYPEDNPHIALGAKHGNVCGAGIDADETIAIQRMLEGDLRAIFGGEVLVNFTIGEEQAEVLLKHNVEQGKRLLDVVIAPEVTPEALELMKRKGGKMRVFANPALRDMDESALDTSPMIRSIRGGFIVQDNYTFVLDYAAEDIAFTGAEMSPQEKRDLLLAWAIGSTSTSNTITLAKDGMVIGNGVGQQDRVSAVELALKRANDAGHDTRGAVAYSDSFFPFTDGPLTLAKAGISAVLSTSGSVRDEEVFGAFANNNVAVAAIPDSMGRGFYAH